ncbi:hypothetical protein DFJ73DRAFT_112855 [Zopfochytrium polystomum]|nr:hypothetical protein DFJ73DRAFT_112855 [Zopfochytrium polystomum]
MRKPSLMIADGTLTQLKYTGASQAGNVSLTSDGTVRNNAKGALYPAGELTFSNYTSAVIVPTPPTTTSVINGNAFPDLVVPYYSNLSLSASSDAASLYFKYIFTSASLPKLSISILQDMSMSFFSTSAQTYCVYNMPFKTNTTMAANLQGFNNFVGSGFASNFSLSRLTAFTSSSLTFSNTFNLAIPQTQLSIDNIGDVTLFVNVTDTTISSTPFLLGTMQIPNLQLNSTSGSFATAMSLQVNFPTNPDGSLITTAPLFKLFQNQFQSADRRTARGEAPQEVIKVSVFGTTASTSIPVLQDAFASLNISTTVTIPAVPSTVSFSPQSIGLPKLVSYTPNTLVFSTTVTFIHPDAFTLINIGNVNFTATLSDDNSTLGTFTVNSFSLTAGDKPYPVAMTVTFSLSNGNVNTSTTLYNKFLRAFDSTQPTITPPNWNWPLSLSRL